MNSLEVLFKGEMIGRLNCLEGELNFCYESKYLAGASAKKLSSSLPLQEASFNHNQCRAFFSGLLPDENIREILAKHLLVSPENIFALLKAVGGECAGAVSLRDPEATNDHKAGYKKLSKDDLKALLLELDSRPFLEGDEGIRMSAGGAQNKIMLCRQGDSFTLPLYGSPSTHILKPAMKNYKDSVFNEFFCMKLAKELGINVPEVEVLWLDDQANYLITRYDRVLGDDGEIERLHQEDFCQALNIPPELKYENEGGPSFKQCYQLLEACISRGVMRGTTKLEFFKIIIYNFLIGNGDAHAKNFSLLYRTNEESLAPFYDLVSTLVYVNPYKAKMAMKLGGEYKFRNIDLSKFEKLADNFDIKFFILEKQINFFVANIVGRAESLAMEFNNDAKLSSDIYQRIIDVVKMQLEKLV